MIDLLNIKGLDLDHIQAKYCDSSFNEKVCNQPKEGCVEIFGDVEIGEDFDFESMKTVEAIYGSLIINGTSLEDFSFLESLMYISQLEQGKHPLIVENNLSLINMTFPKLKKIQGQRTWESIVIFAIFNNNNEALSERPRFCTSFKSSIKLMDEKLYIDGKRCSK
ncbi:hypothetical protein CAEBREN_12466 [Caenorhabditis brenneri]|uniref:Receptor L-domain domain-containing protein n=1 Tax=Caenorhabditis brenneri TaxID=135651 RepID=G0PGE2_CAEBE|nr:hypothetical protein CAEBREN_12466 [Caenorhabditis brenneri]